MTEHEQKICDSCRKVYSQESDFLHGTSQWRVCDEGNLWFNCSCASTLMLPKGKFSWFSPEQFLSPESKSVFNRIATVKDLPHIPSIIMDLQRKVQDENVDGKELANLVREDPFLAAEVLRIASNLKNLRALDRAKLKSIEHSIAFIGRKTLAELLVVASISSFKLPTKKFSIDIVWKPALLTAVLAEALAFRFNPALRADEVYLAACLANIGKVVSALCFPDDTDAIYAKALSGKDLSWQEVEKSLPHIDHCILGEIGASLWGLPQYVGEVARLHHAIPAKVIGKNQSTLSEIVAFANAITPWVGNSLHDASEASIKAMAERFGLDDPALDALLNDLKAIPAAA